MYFISLLTYLLNFILYRAITMFITVLPKADPGYTCHPKLNNQTELPVLGKQNQAQDIEEKCE